MSSNVILFFLFFLWEILSGILICLLFENGAQQQIFSGKRKTGENKQT